MGQANIKRGEKWTLLRAKALFKNKSEDVKWIDAQEQIVKDIKEYEDSIKPVEKETKSKKEK